MSKFLILWKLKLSIAKLLKINDLQVFFLYSNFKEKII